MRLVHEPDAAIERKRALWSVIMAAIMTPALVACCITGPQWPVIVYVISFNAGYMVERINLCRKIIGLIRQVESLPPPASQSS